MSRYLNDGVLLYVNELVDWKTTLRMRKGEDADPEAEREAMLETLLRTCHAISIGLGWHPNIPERA